MFVLAASHRQWDLVVNANSSPYKRMHLASGVTNRVHISYAVDSSAAEDAPCAALAGGCCVNRQEDGIYRCVALAGHLAVRV